MIRVAAIFISALVLAGCTATTLKCPPMLSISKADKAAIAAEYKSLTPEQKAAFGKLVRAYDSRERVCAAIEKAR